MKKEAGVNLVIRRIGQLQFIYILLGDDSNTDVAIVKRGFFGKTI